MMRSNKILIYALVILAGISVGFLGPDTYQELAQEERNSATDELAQEEGNSAIKEIEGEIISQDPNLSSFRQSTNETQSAESYVDISRKTFEEKRGPWFAGTWKYVPGDLLRGQNRNDSLIINSGSGGDGNALQVMEIPENSDTYLYMEGRSATDLVPGQNCDEVQGFLAMYEWGGEVPMQNLTGENIVDSSVKNKTSTFSSEQRSMTMEIPERFEGEDVIFVGGVTTEMLCGLDHSVNHLKIDRLLVAER